MVWGGSYQYWCTKYTLYCGLRFRTEQFEFICETVVVVNCKSKRYTQEEGGAHVAPICALVVGYTESTTVEINAHVY
jgi:hypothetical protein